MVTHIASGRRLCEQPRIARPPGHKRSSHLRVAIWPVGGRCAHRRHLRWLRYYTWLGRSRPCKQSARIWPCPRPQAAYPRALRSLQERVK
ncbi:hypothetical protein BHE74_00055236 [Ensete ventricosum]|nr:hypothetical protein BHE74_00055236 [Ensete ventricosum]